MMSNSNIKSAGDILNGIGVTEELPEQDIECPVHGTYRGKSIIFPWLGERGKHISYTECPKCEAERRKKEQEEKAEREQYAYISRLKNMNIGSRYWETDFHNFNAYTDELKHHLNIALNFANNPDGKLVMLGDNGTGKTHLAIAILKKTGGVIYTPYEIGVNLRQSYSGDSREKEVLKELCEANMLVIDEIGRSKGSEPELNWLSHVINKRHENMRPIILISNRHLRIDCPQGEKGCDKDLERFFDNDVISRITEDGLMLKFTGDDYRRRNREEFVNRKKAEANS